MHSVESYNVLKFFNNFCDIPGRGLRSPYTVSNGRIWFLYDHITTIFCRITWFSITIVHRHVVYGETQLCTEVNWAKWKPCMDSVYVDRTRPFSSFVYDRISLYTTWKFTIIILSHVNGRISLYMVVYDRRRPSWNAKKFRNVITLDWMHLFGWGWKSIDEIRHRLCLNSEKRDNSQNERNWRDQRFKSQILLCKFRSRNSLSRKLLYEVYITFNEFHLDPIFLSWDLPCFKILDPPLLQSIWFHENPQHF